MYLDVWGVVGLIIFGCFIGVVVLCLGIEVSGDMSKRKKND